MGQPHISVIIPAFNQAQYLDAAIQSVLAQTYRDFEVIVIDDGSTDDTPRIAAGFGDAIRYLRQDNQGLAGARNTGIRNANGAYFALLDSDDEWLPGYLGQMVGLAEQNPTAGVLHCQARCMDSSGHDLSQTLGGPIGLPEQAYQTLLRFDYLIPSTATLERSAVVAAGLFDPALRSCEDWDLWLRLARQRPIVGTRECLARYRIHRGSLSTNLDGMHLAARAVINKHFGSDDGQIHLWSADKRRAYGGLYRYQALTSVMRQSDWTASGRHLARALHVDPTLSQDLDLFFDLAMGAQPVGYRLTATRLDLPGNAINVERMLSQVFGAHGLETRGGLRRVSYGTAYKALGLVAYNTDQLSLCRKYLVRALLYRPDFCRDPMVVGNLAKSLVGRSVVEWAKRRKASLA